MSQRDSSPSCSNADTVQPRNSRSTRQPIEDDHEERITTPIHQTMQSSDQSHLHPRNCSRPETPSDHQVFRHNNSRSRQNQNSPIFTSESTAYGTSRMIHSDLADSVQTNRLDTMDSQKNRYSQSTNNNSHCQRNLLPVEAAYLQHLMNEGELPTHAESPARMTSRRTCTIEDRYRNKHIEDRSISPTSSSDATEIFTSPRHSRHRQHSSHRHRTTNPCKENHYQPTITPQIHQHHSPLHRPPSHCHRYHEIGQPTSSCSPVCDSGIKEDDASSSALSNNRDRFSSCEDINGQVTICPTTTTSNPLQSNNLHGPMQITSAIEHHRMSSGISCESSTSSPSIRNHEHCMAERHRNHIRHSHTIQQQYALDHSQRLQINHPPETKSPLLIGLEPIQIATAPPPKNKCQCHIDHMQQQAQHNQEQMQQQNHQLHHHHNLYHEHEQFGQDKRTGGIDGGNVDSIVVNSPRIHQPPALPPRPPPRPNRRYETSAYDNRADNGEGGCCKKYVVLCCLCGGLSAAVGSLFLAVHAVLSAHTASLMHFETVPSYIPGTMLILMGLFTMLLARRKHRYGLLMKVCGSVGVVCALVCVLVTVTTTVIHMSKLQSLRECVYTARARSCTCYGATQGRGGDAGVLFEGTPHCEAVHGALYACLRALFGVSVAGILACIFSCMLVYQLLSHEKKKMYWEQLELRCRSLYGQGGGAPVGGTSAGSCGCCNDCGGVNPWWAQTPGNLYTPNPDLAPSGRWRLPWSRSRGPAPSPDSNYGFNAQTLRHSNDISDPTRREAATAIQPPYGFIDSRQSTGPYSVLNPQNNSYTPSNASYSVLEAPVPLWGPPPPYSDPNSPARRPQIIEPKCNSSGGSTSGLSNNPVNITNATPSRLVNVKRTVENFENSEDHHVQRTPQHCSAPTDNYENTEEITNVPELDCRQECVGHDNTTMKARRSRRNLKGVENDAFQQEQNQITAQKQSESELYFGDVSSCCGPESSLYEMAVEKEMNARIEEIKQKEYISRMNKHRLSKRNRMPLPLPPSQSSQELMMENTNERSYTNGEDPLGSPAAFLAPDAQYEVIQQGSRFGYYSSKSDDEFREMQTGYNYYEDEAEDEITKYRSKREDDPEARSDDDISRREHQCCSTNEPDWPDQTMKTDDGVCPINV